MIFGVLSTIFIFTIQSAGWRNAVPDLKPSDPIPVARFMDLLMNILFNTGVGPSGAGRVSDR